MIIKIPIAKVVLLVDRTHSMLEYCNLLNAMGKQVGLQFVEPQVGAGYLQWRLQGDGWSSFFNLDVEKKTDVAKVYEERRARMRTMLDGSSVQDAVLTVPSEENYVFFRETDGEWEVALTAWGYKFTNTLAGREISAWVTLEELQEVNLGFSVNDELVCNMPFFLDGLSRSTGTDGYFHAGGPLKVGRQFMIKTSNGQEFLLTVEKGKSNYVYDLARYAHVEVSVTKDGEALANQQCNVSFNGTDYPLQTDEKGLASLEIPLVVSQDGTLMDPQPECVATCNSRVQSGIPYDNGETFCFRFDFTTEIAPPPSPPSPPTKMIKIRLFDKDGKPMQNLPIKLQRANAEDLEGCTDADGNAYFPASLFTDGEMVKLVCTAKGRMKLTMLKPDN